MGMGGLTGWYEALRSSMKSLFTGFFMRENIRLPGRKLGDDPLPRLTPAFPEPGDDLHDHLLGLADDYEVEEPLEGVGLSMSGPPPMTRGPLIRSSALTWIWARESMFRTFVTFSS